MAVQVVQGHRQTRSSGSSAESNPLGRMLTIAGGVAGAATGGLQGAALGAGLGQTAGGILAPQASNQSQQVQAPQPQNVATGGDVLSRKLGDIDNSSMNQIAQSIDSLKFIQDDDLRMKFAQPLLQAYNAAGKAEGQG